MNKKSCECCNGSYATGKRYGDYWYDGLNKSLDIKGLCQLCNVSSHWYVPKKKCHYLEEEIHNGNSELQAQ